MFSNQNDFYMKFLAWLNIPLAINITVLINNIFNETHNLFVVYITPILCLFLNFLLMNFVNINNDINNKHEITIQSHNKF